MPDYPKLVEKYGQYTTDSTDGTTHLRFQHPVYGELGVVVYGHTEQEIDEILAKKVRIRRWLRGELPYDAI